MNEYDKYLGTEHSGSLARSQVWEVGTSVGWKWEFERFNEGAGDKCKVYLGGGWNSSNCGAEYFILASNVGRLLLMFRWTRTAPKYIWALGLQASFPLQDLVPISLGFPVSPPLWTFSMLGQPNARHLAPFLFAQSPPPISLSTCEVGWLHPGAWTGPSLWT